MKTLAILLITQSRYQPKLKPYVPAFPVFEKYLMQEGFKPFGHYYLGTPYKTNFSSSAKRSNVKYGCEFEVDYIRQQNGSEISHISLSILEHNLETPKYLDVPTVVTNATFEKVVNLVSGALVCEKSKDNTTYKLTMPYGVATINFRKARGIAQKKSVSKPSNAACRAAVQNYGERRIAEYALVIKKLRKERKSIKYLF